MCYQPHQREVEAIGMNTDIQRILAISRRFTILCAGSIVICQNPELSINWITFGSSWNQTNTVYSYARCSTFFFDFFSLFSFFFSLSFCSCSLSDFNQYSSEKTIPNIYMHSYRSSWLDWIVWIDWSVIFLYLFRKLFFFLVYVVFFYFFA